MGRCLSLFGLLFFALGLVALTSSQGGAAQPAVPEGPPATPDEPPRTSVFGPSRYPVQFSLN
jgi:hypothetical protein